MLTPIDYEKLRPLLEERGCRELASAVAKKDLFLKVEEHDPPYITGHYWACRDIHHLKDTIRFLLAETKAYEVVAFVPGNNPVCWHGRRINEHDWAYYYGHLYKDGPKTSLSAQLQTVQTAQKAQNAPSPSDPNRSERGR